MGKLQLVHNVKFQGALLKFTLGKQHPTNWRDDVVSNCSCTYMQPCLRPAIPSDSMLADAVQLLRASKPSACKVQSAKTLTAANLDNCLFEGSGCVIVQMLTDHNVMTLALLCLLDSMHVTQTQFCMRQIWHVLH